MLTAAEFAVNATNCKRCPVLDGPTSCGSIVSQNQSVRSLWSGQTPNKMPCWLFFRSAASEPQRGSLRWLTLPDSSWNNPIRLVDLSSLTVHWDSYTPPSLSHTFHWKAKWYSMLPIASPSTHASSLCCWQIRKELHGYLGAGDGQVEILAWRGPRLDRLQTSPWPFSPPETQLHRQRAKPHGMKSKNADVLKIISHLMRKYDSRGMLK